MNPPREHFASTGLTAVSPETNPGVDRHALARVIAAHNEIMCPGYMTGLTDEILDGPSLTLTESVEAGWIAAEEKRMIEGTASREDLVALKYSAAEVEELLAEQQDRSCASST